MSKRPPIVRAATPRDAGPFSRPLEVHTIPENGLDMEVEARPDELAAIAADAGLVAVGSLEAQFRIERRAGGRLTVEGEVEAVITQTCVVSLEPFDSTVTRAIDVTFAPQPHAIEAPALPARLRRRAEARPGERGERDEPPPRPVVVPGNDDQEDPPDPIVDGRIDFGAVALEFLTLSLDLYPRRPGIRFSDVSVGDKGEAPDSPFAALKRLEDPS